MLSTILTYATQAKARLLEQYRGLSKFSALVGELGDRAQEAETAIFGLLGVLELGTATGVWLERLGGIVGERRQASADAAYRRYVLARVQANKSSGTVEDLIAVCTEWHGAPCDVVITDCPPAGIQLDFREWSASSGSVSIGHDEWVRLVKLLSATKAAGVGVDVLYVEDAIDAFTFSSGSTVEVDATFGLDGGGLADARRA